MDDIEDKSDIQPRKSCEIDQDPDYHEAAPPDRKKLKLMEDTGKFCFGEKVKQILTKCFDQELDRQENEIKQIDEAIFSVQQKLHVLRNVILQNFFSGKRNANIVPTDTPSEPIIHPSVKQNIGKRPPTTYTEATPINSEDSNKESQLVDIKIPRYVPPKLPEVIAAVPVRGEHRCSRKKIHIGNVSKWIPVCERTDNSSHKWMVYVRGPKENPDVSTFVKKIVFYLHPSYAPHDVVQISSYPFHVTRRGWGEFPLRVQLFFDDPLSKPVNVIHHLKLDRTYTGLQTLGSETVIDVFINDAENEAKEHSRPVDLLHRLEQANEDMDVSLTEKEASFDENVLLSIKTEKEDKEESVENMDVSHHEKEAEEIFVKDSSTISIKTEKGDTIQKEEAPLPRVMAEKHATKPPIPNSMANGTPPKLVQIKSLFNPATRFLAPGAVTFPNRIVPQSLIRPMIVRCINKEGVPIRLPINLLRKAIVVRPSRLIRPGESLLRAPLLRAPLSSVLKMNPKPEVQPQKIEVVKSDTHDFEETVLAYKWLTTSDCVRIIAQHIQIIDSRASEPSFRSRYPFTCPFLETFLSWNIGKQRSCEWHRARAVRELLAKCKIKDKDMWSVKTILRWCRHHGYSPMTSNPIKSKPTSVTAFHPTLTAHKALGDPVETDCVVDIETTITSIRNTVNHKVNDVIALNSEDPDLTNWITAQLKKFGCRLSPELCDNALVNFTNIMFTRLWKSLADDLLRRSLRESWVRHGGSNPEEITLSDAFNAIVQRPEFDLFTDVGLSLPTDTSRSIN